MLEFSRVLKECFWDIEISESEIMAIVSGKNFRKKQFVFEKILLNSTKMFKDLRIFSNEELMKLLKNMKVPSFNSNFIFRRKNLVEVYFFDSDLLIDELKWVA